jgi:hypothetical protein
MESAKSSYIISAYCRLRDTGTFPRMLQDVGSPRCVRNVRMDEQTILVVLGQPTISTRRLGACAGTARASVHSTLEEQQLKPNNILPMQELVP